MLEVLTATNRMRDYLPLYWHEYREMIELLKTQGFELEYLGTEKGFILVDAFILDMREERIEEWERWLRLPPNGTLMDRRLAILNYFAVMSKMSRESIQAIVAAMYNGARAKVFFKDSTIHVIVKPLPNHIDEIRAKWLDIKNMFETWGDLLDASTQWISNVYYKELYDYLWIRKPAHLKLLISRYEADWQEVTYAETWGVVKNDAKTWGELKLRTWEK